MSVCVEAGDIFALIPVLLLVGFCCDMQNTPFCMRIIAAAGSLWTAPRLGFFIKEEKRVPPFLTPFMLSYLAISATPGCIQRSWTPGQRKSDHPLPPPSPSCCSLRWGIALPSQDTPFALYQPRWTLSRSHMASVSYTANLLYLLMKTSPVFSFCRCWNPAASRW